MDGKDFDDLVRKFATTTSRRRFFKGLLGGGAAVAAASAVRVEPSSAAPLLKVDICHYDRTLNTWFHLNVNGNSLDTTAHAAHTQDFLWGNCCTNADCSSLDTDCKVGVCSHPSRTTPSVCVLQDRPNNTPCDDETVCNGRETCQGGVCTAGTPLQCGTSDACNTRGCDPVTGCFSEPVEDDTPCDDETVCNGRETCQGGVCTAGTPLDCSSYADDCNEAACDAVDGCYADPVDDDTPCDDDTVCNGRETCLSGVCTSGEELDCSYLTDACNVGACDPVEGCYADPVEDDTPCDDETVCNGRETCQGGVCTDGTALDCRFLDDDCNVGACDPVDGCFADPLPDDTPCDDETVCNGRETCQSGVCTAGTPLDCSSYADDCNEAACDPVDGCFADALPNDTPCDDDTVCNGHETCQGGVCIAGTELDCSYLTDDCNVGACDPVDGCFADPVEDGTGCEDGLFCTVDDFCQGGVCMAGSPRNCDDGVTCTVDSCSEELEMCINDPNLIGDACSTVADCCLIDGVSLRCNSVTGRCSSCGDPGNGVACGIDEDCCGNQRCYLGTCCSRRLPGATCSQNGQCCSGVCTSGACQ